MGEGVHDGLGFVEAIISPSVNCVNQKNQRDSKKFSGRGFPLSEDRVFVRISARAFGDAPPAKRPRFPYKPPANTPPRRRKGSTDGLVSKVDLEIEDRATLPEPEARSP